MRDKVILNLKIVAILFVLLMLVSCVAPSIAGDNQSTNNASNQFDNFFPPENITANNTPFSLSSNTYYYVPDDYAKIQWATNNASAGNITIDTAATWDAGTYTYDTVVITNNATLIFDGNVTLNAINLIIDTNSSISADAMGYPHGEGPGAGKADRTGGGSCSGYLFLSYGSGGGYGGKGGEGAYPACMGEVVEGGPSYGSLTQPTDLGSGGGNQGGTGGGAIRINVTNNCMCLARKKLLVNTFIHPSRSFRFDFEIFPP
jgi:hypothetical protein